MPADDELRLDAHLDEWLERHRLAQSEVRIRRSPSVVDGGVYLLPTKSARPRVLCVADSVVEAVACHREEHEHRRAAAPAWDQRWDLVFTGDTGGHLASAAVSREWTRVLPGQDADAAARFERPLWAGAPGRAEERGAS